jgi:hypothetical protein
LIIENGFSKKKIVYRLFLHHPKTTLYLLFIPVPHLYPASDTLYW